MVATSRVLKVTLSALMAATIAAVACTNDYDQFHSPEAVAAGTSGSPATGGTGTGGSGGSIISGGTGPTGGSGGTLAGGSGGVTTGGVGGAGGSVGGTGGSGGVTTCPSGQKLCSTGGCVATDQIATGCGQTSCDPCSATVLNATPVCDTNTGFCVYQGCNTGFGDCNFLATDGCETATSATVLHCGGCESFRTCSETNVASVDCPDIVCTSTCQLGFGNCTTPAWPQADNGCETNTTADNGNCGGCGNNCAAQSSGFSCQNMTCGCTSDTQCKVGSGPSGTITCNTTSHRCVCAGVTCNAGEACNRTTNFACSCNGGAACGAGSTCCQTPAGCKDLTSDPTSCGACGHACPPGFACSGGQCVCDADTDCNLGSTGVCSGGVCVCAAVSDGGAGAAGAAGATDSGSDADDSSVSTGGTGGTATPCGAGQRCLPTGSCG